jgi:hypothetical protein
VTGCIKPAMPSRWIESCEQKRRHRGKHVPDKDVVERAKKDLQKGKSPSTAAGEFVRREMEHVRQGKHGARSPQQAIAIGLSEARRAGVPLRPPKAGQAKEKTRKSAERDYRVGQEERQPRSSSRKRGEATKQALRRERRTSASRAELSKAAKAGRAKRRSSSTGAARRSGTRTAGFKAKAKAKSKRR